MTTWKQHKQELMKDPKFKEAYDALEPEFQLASALIKARIDKKMTQTQVAEQAGVSRTVIARLESGTTNPTLDTINRVAGILGKELKLVAVSR